MIREKEELRWVRHGGWRRTETGGLGEMVMKREYLSTLYGIYDQSKIQSNQPVLLARVKRWDLRGGEGLLKLR